MSSTVTWLRHRFSTGVEGTAFSTMFTVLKIVTFATIAACSVVQQASELSEAFVRWFPPRTWKAGYWLRLLIMSRNMLFQHTTISLPRYSFRVYAWRAGRALSVFGIFRASAGVCFTVFCLSFFRLSFSFIVIPQFWTPPFSFVSSFIYLLPRISTPE